MSRLRGQPTHLSLLFLAIAGCSAGTDKTVFTDTDKSDFKVGQVWNYQTRTNESGSTLVILKVETAPGWGTIVHVGLTGLKIKTPTGLQDVVPHMPFDEGTLKSNITTKVTDHGQLTNFQQGYGLWREAASDGKGGVFTISVAEVINAMEQAFTRTPVR